MKDTEMSSHRESLQGCSLIEIIVHRSFSQDEQEFRARIGAIVTFADWWGVCTIDRSETLAVAAKLAVTAKLAVYR